MGNAGWDHLVILYTSTHSSGTLHLTKHFIILFLSRTGFLTVVAVASQANELCGTAVFIAVQYCTGLLEFTRTKHDEWAEGGVCPSTVGHNDAEADVNRILAHRLPGQP